MHIICFCFVWYSNTKFKCWALLRFIVESPLFFGFFSFCFVLFKLNIKYYYCIYTLGTSISSFSHSILVLWLKLKILISEIMTFGHSTMTHIQIMHSLQQLFNKHDNIFLGLLYFTVSLIRKRDTHTVSRERALNI